MATPQLRHGGDRHRPTLKMAVGAIGIVFGDIGTSPLYAFRETFAGHHPLALDELHIMGVVSLIFWSMTIVVTIKYVGLLMRADNKGQGGTPGAGGADFALYQPIALWLASR